MKKLLRLEEVAQFILSIALFNQLSYSWWVFPTCILLPDLSMIGYLFNTKTGALLYNVFHHKLLAVGIIITGFLLKDELISLTGIILFGHSSMDRIMGYGLKYEDDFKNTHLGWIGKREK